MKRLAFVACVAAAASAVAADATWYDAGTGIWDLTALNWNGGADAWTAGDKAVFAGTGGVVTVEGEVDASGIAFNSSNYVVNATAGSWITNSAAQAYFGMTVAEGQTATLNANLRMSGATFRKYGKGDHFEINIEYCTCPSLEGKCLILADPMLATGSSILLAYGKLVEQGGEPACTHFVCPIASRYAVEDLSKTLPDSVTLWVAAIDEELTSHSYIVPGLGDAGDLAFGEKL